MFVHIILRSLTIERVFVRGLDEEDGLDGLDLFSESQYKVMRMITSHAAAATLHFYHTNTTNHPDATIRLFLQWLRYPLLKIFLELTEFPGRTSSCFKTNASDAVNSSATGSRRLGAIIAPWQLSTFTAKIDPHVSLHMFQKASPFRKNIHTTLTILVTRTNTARSLF